VAKGREKEKKKGREGVPERSPPFWVLAGSARDPKERGGKEEKKEKGGKKKGPGPARNLFTPERGGAVRFFSWRASGRPGEEGEKKEKKTTPIRIHTIFTKPQLGPAGCGDTSKREGKREGKVKIGRKYSGSLFCSPTHGPPGVKGKKGGGTIIDVPLAEFLAQIQRSKKRKRKKKKKEKGGQTTGPPSPDGKAFLLGIAARKKEKKKGGTDLVFPVGGRPEHCREHQAGGREKKRKKGGKKEGGHLTPTKGGGGESLCVYVPLAFKSFMTTRKNQKGERKKEEKKGRGG